MFLRSAALACAAILVSMTAPAIAETPGAESNRCEAMSLRVYFSHGSAQLSPMAAEALDAASRNVADCDYSELHVAIDASNSLATRRGNAIVNALSNRAWDVARIERTGAHSVAYSNGPEFAEVTMTPNVMPVTNAITSNDAGV